VCVTTSKVPLERLPHPLLSHWMTTSSLKHS